MSARASKILGALAIIATERRAVSAELSARESRRGPGGIGFEPGTGAGWGALDHAQARRVATANLENALIDARDALQRALMARDTLAAMPPAPMPGVTAGGGTVSPVAARLDALAAEVDALCPHLLAAHPALPPHAVERITRHFRAAAHEIRGVEAVLDEVRAAETLPPTEGV